MYLPRELISHLYLHLVRTHHAQSSPVLILVALEPDALCACRILTALLKRDYIAHNIIPVSGYGDLARAGEAQVRPMRIQNGGSGGTVVCLGVGGLIDVGVMLGLEATEEGEDPTGGVEVWIIDARRPWNLSNVFGGKPPQMALGEINGNIRSKQPEISYGRLHQNYRPGKGGIIVYDDGDIDEELAVEREAYFALEQMPEIEDDGNESDESDTQSESPEPAGVTRPSKKRKSWSEPDEENDSEDEDGRPRQRRRSNSVRKQHPLYDRMLIQVSRTAPHLPPQCDPHGGDSSQLQPQPNWATRRQISLAQRLLLHHLLHLCPTNKRPRGPFADAFSA